MPASTAAAFSMPAPEILSRPINRHPALGHVNLMVDTYIANASIDDLRATIRGLLASGIPGIASAFTNAARNRLHQTKNDMSYNHPLFTRCHTGEPRPTQHLRDVLAKARSLYGAGMGFASLEVLAVIVRATTDLRWGEESEMADTLAIVDADIAQAIQSSKEEIEAGRVDDLSNARQILNNLRVAVNTVHGSVGSWRGELPFESASCSIEHFKL